jgi:VCBS repeat-containing protein
VDFLNAQFRKKRLRGAVVALFLLGALVPTARAQLGLIPSITVQPLGQTVQEGGTVVFTVEAFSLTTMSYQWYRNNNAIAGANDSTYTRTPVLSGDAGFYKVVVANFLGGTESDVVELVVIPNTPPVGSDDAFNTTEDVALVVPAGGVLSNDTDAEGHSLSAVLVTNVAHGTLSFNANGGFTYTPASNYFGSDSFSYRPRDVVSTGNVTTVTLLIASVEDVPIARNDSTNMLEDTSVVVQVLLNDTEPDGQTMTLTDVSTTNGTVVISGTNILFTPSLNFAGVVNFSYSISDGLNTATGYVSVTVTAVNDVPVGNNDSYTTAEDVPLTIGVPGVLANDTDVDSTVLGALLVTNVTRGTLNLSTNGNFIYTPNLNVNGTDQFSYRPRDATSTGNVTTVTINVTPVNDIPIANSDSTNTIEDTSVTIKVLLNDSDVEGPVTITGTSTTNGTATISGTNIVFTPGTNFNGTVVFNYTISDGTNSATTNVTVTVTAANDPPVASNDTFSTLEDVTLIIPASGILTNDVDVDSGVLTAVLVASTSQGSLTFNPNGSFSYTPNLNFNGTDSFTYRARDGAINGNLATVTINVIPVNDVPVANNDSTNTLEDVSVRIRVLANDTDVEGGPLAISTTSTTNGTAVISGSDVVFTPAPNYFGTVVFSYVVSDGTNSSTGNVTVIVASVNDAPPVAANNTYTTQEEVMLTVATPGVLGNDSDVDGDSFTALLVSGVTHGTLNFNANGSFNYTPDTNYAGSDSFTYRATDGMATGNVATVTINVTPVNDAPVARSDATNTLEDTSVTIDVLANDTDVDNDPLLITNTSTTNGTAAIKGGTAIVFTPATNFYGTVVFSYTISDGFYTATSSVTVTVISVNDAPPVANDENYTVAEDALLTVAAPGVLSNDTDADADPKTALLISSVSAGTLTFNTNGSFSYRPNTNFYGTDNFSYRATDGIAFGNLAIVTITVTPVNDTPLLLNDVTNTLEDTSVTIPVLVNDSDVEGTALIITGTSTTNGAAIVSGANIVFTPATNFNGTAVFSYTVSDGTNSATANVTVAVIPVNDVPVAIDDAVSVLEDNSVTINVLANDSDVERAPLTVTSVSSTNGTAVISGTNIVYTPPANYFGTVFFQYTMSDGTNSATARVTVTVISVNDAPLVLNDVTNTLEDTSVTIPVLVNDSDVEGTALIITGTSTTNGTAMVSGTNIVFTPSTNFNGVAVFSYTVWDGTNSATANVTVTVIPVNDVPVAVNDAVNVLEDKSVTINVLANDSDVEGARLTVTSVSSTNGTAVISGTNIVFTPSLNYFGTTLLDYTMSDGTNSATARVTVTVISVNDAPVANSDSYSTDEDVRLTVPVPGILANDTDAENNSLTALLVSSVSHGALTFNGNGSFIYTPATNYFGNDSFTYRAWDGTSNSAVTTVQLVTRLTTPLKIVSCGFVSNGFNLRLQGPSPAAYTILGSSNNIDWRAIGSRGALTGSAEYTDTNASRTRVYYYNAMVNPQSTIVLEQNTQGGNKVDLRPGKPGAQSFQHGAVGEADYTISKVVFYISRDGTAPNANLNFSIGTGINSGALAGSSVSISPSSITNTSGGSTFQAMEIIYSTPVGPLAAGVPYYLNLENEPPNGARVYVSRSGGSSYSLGTFFRGGSDQGYDTIFEISGQ